MPANKKYLAHSGWTRLSRILVGFIGGFILTISFHLALTVIIDKINVLITMSFTGFILWGSLMIIAFLIKETWKTWSLYLGLTLLCSIVIYFGKIQPMF